MDEHSASLLGNLIGGQGQSLRQANDLNATGRGKSLTALADRLIVAAEQQAQGLMLQMETADARSRAALGRKLSRCRMRLDVAHLILADYGPDIGRQDIPTGLLCLIDALVVELLPASVDPLVHLDTHRMYSTLSLDWHVASLLGESHDASSVGVVVFNLPALDPGNVLYAPILAHEVTHTLVSHQNLLTRVFTTGDLAAVSQLLSDGIAAASATADAAEWKQRLGRWVNELICDAVATTLSGPSFLFAATAFLPASASTGQLSGHPYAVERIKFCVRQLTSMDWRPYLDTHFPTVMAWLDSLPANAAVPADPQEDFLRRSIELLSDDIVAVASSAVSHSFDSAAFNTIESELVEMLTAGIPPSRAAFGTPTAWDLVLAGWQTALKSRGDLPASIAEAAEDQAFNQFLVKALEVATITKVWDEG